MYLNIEPIHFAGEQTVTHLPAEVPGRESSLPRAFAVLLDDIANPGTPTMEREARGYVSDVCDEECLFVRETRLAPLVWALLDALDASRLAVRHQRLFFRHESEETLLCRAGPSTESPLRENNLSIVKGHLQKSRLPTDDILHLMRPTCQLYTVAWYVLRLSTSLSVWTALARSESTDTITEHIHRVADMIDSRSFSHEAHLLTYVPDIFEGNEALARRLGISLQIPELATVIASKEIVRNEFY